MRGLVTEWVTTSGQRLTADCSNVLVLVMFAFNVKNFQMTGKAPLFKDDNTDWDIVAKAGGDDAPTKRHLKNNCYQVVASIS